jgi:F-type H+-transporting ATPase subunit epsilon
MSADVILQNHMHKFKLKILTPDEKLFEGEVEKVVLPTKAGEVTVLANHIPLISLLSIGEIKIIGAESSGAVTSFLVQGGVVDVKQKVGEMDEVIVLADEKLDANNIDLQKFEESIKRAKDANQEDHSAYDPDLLEGLTERSDYFKRLKSR